MNLRYSKTSDESIVACKTIRFATAIALALFCFFPFAGMSQGTNANWYFGEEAGVTFNTTPPSALTNGQIDHPFNGSASISDNSGNLLFYTDGNTVYNKNHVPMQNGNGTLFGSGAYAQDVIIVPMPGDICRYYIFYLKITQSSDTYYYSIVNIAANSGLGTVEVLNTNLNLLPYMDLTTFEFDSKAYKHNMTVIKHDDCSSYWLVINPFHKFFAYHITSTGVSAPVISDAEGDHFTNGYLESNSGSIGGMKASSNGTMIGYATQFLGNTTTPAPALYLWNFDDNTGLITLNSYTNYSNFEYTGHSVEFSPNGNYIYATMGESIIQYSTSNLNSGRQFIHGNNIVSFNQLYSTLQLGMDDRIYVANVASGGMVFTNSLSVINDPDQPGTSSNFALNQLNLSGGHAGWALPQFIPPLCNTGGGNGPDGDGDGIPDNVDNCPTVANPNQLDANGNGIGDVCETCTINASVSAVSTSIFGGPCLNYSINPTVNISGGTINSYEWIISGPNGYSYTSSNLGSPSGFTHTMPGNGTYTICLITMGQDPSGNPCSIDTSCTTVTVNCNISAPCGNGSTVSFTHSSNQLQASFTNTSNIVGLQLVSYSWDFGDGNTSTQASPVHNYATENKYMVCLTVTFHDQTGSCSISSCRKIKVTGLGLIGPTKQELGGPSGTKFDFKTYPNPTANNLNLDITGGKGDYQVVVRSVDGQSILIEELSQSNSARFDFRGLASGMYFITIAKDGERLTKKFVKN